EVIYQSSLLNITIKKKSTWCDTTKKKNWKNINNNNNDDLPVNTSKIGTQYYQLQVQYSYTRYTYYSNIIEVDVHPTSIDTKELTINTNYDYLLNIDGTTSQNAIFASTTRTPVNSTDDIKWETSDDSLAKIDSNGKITATISKNFGDVTIIASVTNSINKQKIKAEKSIHVGGGLEDMSAKLGEDVTFKV